MKIKTEICENIFILTCEGKRLDAAFAKIFLNAMSSSIEDGHTDIVLDLSHVKFVDSTGLGAIICCLKAINDRGYLVLSGVNEMVLSLLQMTNLEGLFLRAGSISEATQLIWEKKRNAAKTEETEEELFCGEGGVVDEALAFASHYL